MDWTIIGVVVAAITCGVIAWQAIEMRRATSVMKQSTDAARKSAELQEIAMTQWVVLENWKNYRRITPEGASLLDINFGIVNPTNWPLSLVTTVFQIRQEEIMSNHFIQLTPKESYTVGISHIPLDDKLYLEGGRGATYVLFGWIRYLDCFGKCRDWKFSGLVWCHKSGTTFTAKYFPNGPTWYEENPKGQQAEGQRTITANTDIALEQSVPKSNATKV